MSKSFLTSINLNKNELLNARIQNLASAPSSPNPGDIFYNTTDNTLYWRSNSAWVAAKDAGATSLYYQTIRSNGTARTQRTFLNIVSGTGTTAAATDDAGNDETELSFDVVYGAATAQTAFGAAAGNGSANSAARSDHTHGTPAAPTAASTGSVANAGNAPYLQTGVAASRPSSGLTVGGIYVDNDDKIAWIATGTTTYTQLNPFSATTTTQAVGDTSAAGTAISYSRGDHRHAMPSFGAVTATTAYGTSSANGSAATLARSDHVHGTPSLTSTAPSTQAIGDAAAVGTGAAPAREDHKHAMPSFGNVTTETTFGAASGNGSAATLARSDHTHGNPTHDAAAHSTLRLNDLATATGDYSMGANFISSSGTPSTANHLTNKAYVDAVAAGSRDFKDSVRVATTAAGTLASSFENGDVVDGVTLATGDRILVKNQAAAAENGIFVVAASGTPTRASDADSNGEISKGTQVYVEEGTANGGQIWIVSATSAATWVPGTSTSTWVMYFAVTSTQAGAGLTATGNVLAVGAGTGIAVAADAVGVDRTTNGAKVAMIYATDIGDGAATSFVVTHNLGSRDVAVIVFPNASPWDEQMVDVEHTSTTTATIRFATAPASNAYRVVIFG